MKMIVGFNVSRKLHRHHKTLPFGLILITSNKYIGVFFNKSDLIIINNQYKSSIKLNSIKDGTLFPHNKATYAI